MLDIDFCLDSSLSAEDSFADNPFSLDFSGADGIEPAELVSPPSSEDERDTDDDMSEEEDESSSSSNHEEGDSIMIQPSHESGCNLPLSAGVDKFDALPAIVLDFDDEAALPFELDMHSDLLLKTPSFSSQEDASVSIEVSFDISKEAKATAKSLIAAKKKLDECMLRTEETRRWIKKHVKKPSLVASSEKVEETISSRVVPVPSASTKKKKPVPVKAHKKKNRIISNKRLASQLIRETSIRLREQEKRNYECSGVVLHRSVSLTSNDSADSLKSAKSASSRTTKPAVSLSSKPSSISDFLRKSRKSAFMSIYN